mmetsp:Transcript_7590/g.9423  ORF Transcript_7590/g.9423 Transcript_7590/m.9423 type:complete len:98 (-) Transcript_7590:207-500(-)
MGCASSAKPAPTAMGAAAPVAAAAAQSPRSPKAPPGSTPATPSAPNRVVEDSDGVHNGPNLVEGLLQDADGDEAHEFFVEDPRTGEMRQVVNDLKVP